jgi:cbb3-type cytochrome c oxidase subunit II
VVFFPAFEDQTEPSDIWRPLTDIEREGWEIYKQNGCQYCHSQYVRAQDWDYGHNRVAQAGDYYGQQPPMLGSERQGPDLSQEGGLRSDDWHYAHFNNPRYTRPLSIMPPFQWLGEEDIRRLTAYIQSLGGTDADKRMERQRYWKAQAIEAYESGPLKNMDWLHSKVPQEWMDLPNPYPPDEASLQRGESVYLKFCIGCHGPVGDGMGPAAEFMNPPPFNFTYLRNWLVPVLDEYGNPIVDEEGNPVEEPGNIGGMLYYQIMNGITGTTMPPFKTELESEKIWDVSNYVAVYFAGRGREASDPERSIPSSFEPPREDEVPATEEDNKENREE